MDGVIVTAAVAGMTFTQLGGRLLGSVEPTGEPIARLTRSSKKFIADVEELRRLYKSGEMILR